MTKVIQLIFWPFIMVYKTFTFDVYAGPVIIAGVIAAIVTLVTVMVGAGANLAFVVPMAAAYIIGTINYYAANQRRGATEFNMLAVFAAAYVLLFGALIILL